MGPKKGKDVVDENYWRTCIEEAPLDEETWKVKVVLIEAAGSDQDRIYLNKFETFAAEEKRFVIKNICKTETTFMINQLGGEKKVKDDNLRVFEEGQAFLKDKKDIPPDILALIIKHLILKMKDEYLFIKRQRLEVKEGMRRESTTMVNRAEVRGTVSVKPPDPPEPEPPPKAKGKKGEPEPLPQTPEPSEGKKYNTQLRVRGEEWRDKVYVDDFPTDGPNLYVAITGFVEPYLPGALVKIGIPLTAVVQIRIDSSTTRVPSSLLRPSKRGQSQTEILTEKSLKFWDDLQQLRIHRDSADDFKNTAFVVFAPPYWDSESLSGSPDKIYDELCYLMYDIQDLTRQHTHYLENMEIINIPMDFNDERYIKYYYQQIQDLPLECVTIYSLLDSVLHTVEKSHEIDEKSSRTSLSTALTINQPRKSGDEDGKIAKAETLVRDVFSTLCKTESQKKAYRLTYGDEYENHKDPIIIHYGDIAKYNTFHLGNINLDNIVWTTLFGMPINQLWQNQNRPQGEIEAKINFHINVLLTCFDREDVETAELNRLIHILACRKLYNNRSSLKKKHLPSSTISEFKKVYLKRSVLAEPLPKCPSFMKSSSSTSPSFPSMTKSENVSGASYSDDPEVCRIRFLFDCPDISELVSAAEISNEQPINHMIDDFEHFEDFSGVSAFQIMRDAFNSFNCVDYKYCEVTDSFILMFFNSHDKDGIAREEWRCHIPTPLCLQDFFDFVLEEHYDWIQNEEKIYDENVVLKSQSECKEIIDPFAIKSCVENTEVELELLMEGSLKFQELAVMEEASVEASETKITSKKTTMSPSSTEVDSKSSRKPKSSAASTPKNLRQSFMAMGTDSNASIEIPAKPFSGYDLGDRRVEVFGQNSTFFSKDGTQVISKYSLTIPMNLEYIILNVVPGNGINEFWLHRALGEYVTSEILDICESFRITSKDQVMINVKKQTYQVPIPMMSMSFIDSKPKESMYKPSTERYGDGIPQIFESKYFHSLFITWPNGLITESVHLDNSPDISHIKQYFIDPMPHLDEEMRCISLNGEVIVFRPSGIIEVLRPDGSFIKITKCEKRIVQTEPPEDMHSETSSDKSKKGKGKEKDKKEKPSKASSKSSKNAIADDGSEIKPPEYELVIEEFETIETNGLRQKWVDEIPTPIEKLLIRTATDYCLGEVFSRRMDGTNSLLNKDGVHVVTFPNNTRIITTYFIEEEEVFPEWTDEEKEYFDLFDSDTVETDTLKSKASMSQKSYIGTYTYSSVASSASKKIGEEEEETKEKERTDGYVSVQIILTIEHANFTTITLNKADNKISVDSPNKSKVVMDSENHYDIYLDSATSAKFDGQSLHVNFEACSECRSNTTSTIKVKTDDMSSVTKMHQHWLRMKDSFCKKVIVNEEGHISIMDEPCSTEVYTSEEVTNTEECHDSEQKPLDAKSENSFVAHGKCREMYLAKTIRFFVLRRELSCSELVHRALLEQHKKACRWQPWCSINQYDTFGDHRNLLSILTPIHLTETEKWLMDSKLADKPKYLTYKDLKKDSGKGFYHWMRPYERFQPKPMKPSNVLPPRLPKAFLLRTLEQQWKESERAKLKGAKELLSAILRYRRVMESDSETILHVPIRDTRSDEERCTDDIIQALGHRIYEDLKMSLAEDVQSRAKANITTKPSPVSTEMSVEGELEEEASGETRALEEERESLVKEVEAAEDMSPNLKRYWRRRAEEFKEEQFYKYLLREGSVPPYFRNVLGGAIWWEMNYAAGEAATKAERKKMKCVCAAEEGTSRTDDTLPYM
ncbi:uncharacterized protein LOC114354282 [Ostrinia furnacalis]|uniref:uncharacterized protein LOC114354282 n=1 Tax=Ostrinia furnacalis TaxID=93504 RepID=UPI00103DE467|nr:uncharacterized protein LOC114354282 [Ostrinia furnacalis]